MSATRLLILGAVHYMQPITGYAIRRELVTWHIEDHVNIKAGSIYSALKTLVRDGCLEATADDGPRTEYRMTPEGEKELMALLREAWWRVKPPAQPLVPALALMTRMPREELARALQARAAQLEAQAQSLAYVRRAIPDGATGADGEVPEHVREIMDFLAGQATAEVEWARQFAARLRSGAYGGIQD